MSENNKRLISQKRAKTNFSTIGLFLVVYILFVMLVPYAFHSYLIEINSSILRNHNLYYGIYFLFLFLGTIIPFFLLRKFSKIPLNRILNSVDVSLSDILVQTIVFFTICLVLTFASNSIFSRFNIEGKLISGIGLSYDISNLDNILYVVILIIVSPIVEEYAFRGVLLNSLSKYGKQFGLFTSSLIFSLAHYNFSEMIPAFVMGLMLGKTTLRYKSIQPAMFIHILFNGFIYLLCIMPNYIAKYMGYVLVAIFMLAIYLYFSGRYERISILKSKANQITNKLFYSRFTVILAILLMLGYTYLFTFYK